MADRRPVGVEVETRGEVIGREVVSGADVHMETAPLSDPNPGDTQSAYEIRYRRTDI